MFFYTQHYISLAFGVKLFPSFGVCYPNSCGQREIEQILMNIFYTAYQMPEYNENATTWWPAVEFCYEGKKPDLDVADISVITLLGVITSLVVISSIVDIWLNRGVDKPPKRGGYFLIT